MHFRSLYGLYRDRYQDNHPGYIGVGAFIGCIISSLNGLFQCSGLLFSRFQLQAYRQFHGRNFSICFPYLKTSFREIFAIFGAINIPPHPTLPGTEGILAYAFHI
jgi:hypothetical protein